MQNIRTPQTPATAGWAQSPESASEPGSDVEEAPGAYLPQGSSWGTVALNPNTCEFKDQLSALPTPAHTQHTAVGQAQRDHHRHSKGTGPGGAQVSLSRTVLKSPGQMLAAPSLGLGLVLA